MSTSPTGIQHHKLSVGQHRSISQYVEKNYGIHVSDQKRVLLEARLGKRIKHLKLDSFKAYLDYLTSEKKIEVSRKAIEQSNENSRIVNNKFNNSLATTTDLVDARLASLVAEINFVMAKADAIAAYYKLLQVSGQNQSIK